MRTDSSKKEMDVIGQIVIGSVPDPRAFEGS